MVAVRTPIPNAKAGVDYVQSIGYSRYVVGVDLGSLQDPTAISIIHDSQTPLPEWGKGYVQKLAARELTVVQAFRLQIGIDWSVITDFIARLMAIEPLVTDGALWIDQTGLGQPAGAMLRERRVTFSGVTITAGDAYNEVEFNRYRCSKLYLLSNMATLLQSGELKIARGIKDAKAFMQQAEDFVVTHTSAGNVTFGTSEGRHDDLLLATAIAAFGAKMYKGPAFAVSNLNW